MMRIFVGLAAPTLHTRGFTAPYHLLQLPAVQAWHARYWESILTPQAFLLCMLSIYFDFPRDGSRASGLKKRAIISVCWCWSLMTSLQWSNALNYFNTSIFCFYGWIWTHKYQNGHYGNDHIMHPGKRSWEDSRNPVNESISIFCSDSSLQQDGNDWTRVALSWIRASSVGARWEM